MNLFNNEAYDFVTKNVVFGYRSLTRLLAKILLGGRGGGGGGGGAGHATCVRL